MAKTKKDLDKDVMYSKIMPSALPRAEEQPEPKEVPDAPLFSAAMGELSDLRAKLFVHPDAFPRTEEAPLIPINLMEYAVANRIDDAFSRFNCCKCDRCKRDVAAIALNRLAPKYVVAPFDQLDELAGQIPGQEVSPALIQAILKVRGNPRH